MSLIDRLQSRWSSWLPRNITMILIIGWALGFILGLSQPDLKATMELDFAKVQAGEIWRLFSFFFVSDENNFLWLLIKCYVTWLIGSHLEMQWGPLRYAIYLVLSWLGIMAAMGLLHSVGGSKATSANFPLLILNLYLGLFFAFATLFPQIQFYIFFVLPVKVKWLGIIFGAITAFQIISAPMVIKAAILISLANYFIFFIPYWFTFARRKKRRVVVVMQEAKQEKEPFHVCSVCGITDKEAPDRQFRVDMSSGEPKDICNVCLDKRKAEQKAEQQAE